MCISPGAVVAGYFAADTVSSLWASWTLSLPYILVCWWGFKQYLTWRYYKTNTQAIKGVFYNHGLTWFFSLAFDQKEEKKKIKNNFKSLMILSMQNILAFYHCESVFPCWRGKVYLGVISWSYGTAACYCNHAQSESARKGMSAKSLETHTSKDTSWAMALFSF